MISHMLVTLKLLSLCILVHLCFILNVLLIIYMECFMTVVILLLATVTILVWVAGAIQVSDHSL